MHLSHSSGGVILSCYSDDDSPITPDWYAEKLRKEKFMFEMAVKALADSGYAGG